MYIHVIIVAPEKISTPADISWRREWRHSANSTPLLLTERLNKQGFWYSKLCTFFKKFVRRYYALFSKYGVSVRTHVHEGICIQLVVKHELSKHIITSRGRST